MNIYLDIISKSCCVIHNTEDRHEIICTYSTTKLLLFNSTCFILSISTIPAKYAPSINNPSTGDPRFFFVFFLLLLSLTKPIQLWLHQYITVEI